jgi:hypothetical protein
VPHTGPIATPQGRGCRPPPPPKSVPRAKANFKAAGEALAPVELDFFGQPVVKESAKK